MRKRSGSGGLLEEVTGINVNALPVQVCNDSTLGEILVIPVEIVFPESVVQCGRHPG